MEIFTTMITPYRADGTVDIETALRYVDFYYESGIDGIFAVCQSSEIFYLSLEERIALNSAVYHRAKELERSGCRPFTVVSSGHVSDQIEDQIVELRAIAASGTDTLIFITNRLDPHNEGDDVFIANAEKILAALPKEVSLGLYECPYPYKRLVSPRILRWCLDTGRFRYMKDTCCDDAILAERAHLLSGTPFKLLNANAQTLLSSYRAGGMGYCGIMCNFHPRLYALLRDHADRPDADKIQSFITALAFSDCLAYPLSAKYHMTLRGLDTVPICRCRDNADLNEYQMSCIRQLKSASDALEQMLST